MRTIGFIGLGAMGAPMARNVLDAGYDLNIYDKAGHGVRELVTAGAAERDSPAEVGRRSDVTIIMVPDDDAVHDVLHGEDGLLEGLSASDYVIQMSTISHEATVDAADAVRSVGGRPIDAPVSGTVGPAEDGTLTVLASGDDHALDTVEPVLEAIGNPIVRCGDVGAGTDMKLFVNLLLGDMMQAFSEALVFGRAHGLDMDDMLTVVEEGAVDSPMFRAKGKNIKEGDFKPAFPVEYMFKDLSLAVDAAAREKLPLPVTAAAREAVNHARALGHGDEDMAAVIKALEEIAGVSVRDREV